MHTQQCTAAKTTAARVTRIKKYRGSSTQSNIQSTVMIVSKAKRPLAPAHLSSTNFVLESHFSPPSLAEKEHFSAHWFCREASC